MRFIGKDEKSGNWKNYVYPSYSVSNTPSSQYLGCCLLRSKWIERAMSNNYIGFPWISYSYSNSSGSKTFFQYFQLGYGILHRLPNRRPALLLSKTAGIVYRVCRVCCYYSGSFVYSVFLKLALRSCIRSSDSKNESRLCDVHTVRPEPSCVYFFLPLFVSYSAVIDYFFMSRVLDGNFDNKCLSKRIYVHGRVAQSTNTFNSDIIVTLFLAKRKNSFYQLLNFFDFIDIRYVLRLLHQFRHFCQSMVDSNIDFFAGIIAEGERQKVFCAFWREFYKKTFSNFFVQRKEQDLFSVYFRTKDSVLLPTEGNWLSKKSIEWIRNIYFLQVKLLSSGLNLKRKFLNYPIFFKNSILFRSNVDDCEIFCLVEKAIYSKEQSGSRQSCRKPIKYSISKLSEVHNFQQESWIQTRKCNYNDTNKNARTKNPILTKEFCSNKKLPFIHLILRGLISNFGVVAKFYSSLRRIHCFIRQERAVSAIGQ